MPTLHVTYIQNLNNTHQTTSRQIRTSYLAQNFDTTIQTRTRNGTSCNDTATQEHTPTHTHEYSILLQHKHCHTMDIHRCSNAISQGPTLPTSQHNPVSESSSSSSSSSSSLLPKSTNQRVLLMALIHLKLHLLILLTTRTILLMDINIQQYT